jgi:hypothetical protein
LSSDSLAGYLNSFTTIRVRAGTKNSHPVDFLQ